jgi:hypothetical protein
VLMGHLRLELADGLLISTLSRSDLFFTPTGCFHAVAAYGNIDMLLLLLLIIHQIFRCLQRADGSPATGAGGWSADQHSIFT